MSSRLSRRIAEKSQPFSVFKGLESKPPRSALHPRRFSLVTETSCRLLVLVILWQPTAQDQLTCRLDLIHSSEWGVGRRVVEQLGLGLGLLRDLDQGVGEGIEGVLVLSLGRLDHQPDGTVLTTDRECLNGFHEMSNGLSISPLLGNLACPAGDHPPSISCMEGKEARVRRSLALVFTPYKNGGMLYHLQLIPFSVFFNVTPFAHGGIVH